MKDDPYFGREPLVARELRLQSEPHGGRVFGKYSSFRVYDATPWHVGQYVLGPWDETDWRRNAMVGNRLGKVVSINPNKQWPGVTTIVIEHPHEWLPRQNFPEWRSMRQFDRVAREVHHSDHVSTPG